jgi:ribosomal protein S4E
MKGFNESEEEKEERFETIEDYVFVIGEEKIDLGMLAMVR